MARHNGSDPTVWMRAINPHTYEGKAQDVDAIYLAHEDLVETIEILKFAVRIPPPPVATRAVPAPVAEPVAVTEPAQTEAQTETSQPRTRAAFTKKR